jgi:hypothetical protein
VQALFGSAWARDFAADIKAFLTAIISALGFLAGVAFFAIGSPLAEF